MNKAVTIYLLGFPGVGKLTIAKHLKNQIPNSEILDNHLSNDCIFPFADTDPSKIDAYSEEAFTAIKNIEKSITYIRYSSNSKVFMW